MKGEKEINIRGRTIEHKEAAQSLLVRTDCASHHIVTTILSMKPSVPLNYLSTIKLKFKYLDKFLV